MVHQLKGLTAIVTGGASGLGAVISRRLASDGVNVCINGLPSDESAGQLLGQELIQHYNVKALFRVADMTKEEDCMALVKDTLEEFGAVDIIISNAGWTRHAAWDRLDAFAEEDWVKSYKINTLAVMWLFKAASPYMHETYQKTGRAGVVLSTNSIAGTGPVGSSFPYSVTKAAQICMVEGLALHNGPFARFNAVCPGLMVTPFSVDYGQERIESLKQQSALKKESSLEDCADCFIMLCKNDSITGKRFTVDSGLSTVS